MQLAPTHVGRLHGIHFLRNLTVDLQYRLMVLTHVLLLVFWLGTDIGVFVAARWVTRSGRAMSERWLLLQLGGVLDVMPRLCSALMFPLGATLARDRWGLHVTPAVLGVLWVIALVWCVAIVTAYRKQNTPIAETIGKVQMAGLVVAGSGAGAWGLSLMNTDAVPDWIAWKIALFGLIYLLSIGIDLTFRPAIRILAEMPAEGGSLDQEERLRSAIDLCCAVVLMLYAVVVASSVLGTFKLPL
jgi:hypothetical protein